MGFLKISSLGWGHYMTAHTAQAFPAMPKMLLVDAIHAAATLPRDIH